MLTLALLLCGTTQARVVINEVMYHAPSDYDDLEYIELYNSGSATEDIGGWSFTKGLKLQFPAGTTIPAQGFVVVARNAERLKQAYSLEPAGVFAQKLSNNGERIELSNAKGAVVDALAYKDSAPWPKGADGESGSLERIDPESAGEDPANWISSPLSSDRERPSGTPGKMNAGFAKSLPPVVAGVRFAPDDPAPGQGISVAARIEGGKEVKDVSLLYRIAGPGFDGAETAVPMQRGADGTYTASIPGQKKDSLVRFRVKATDAAGATRAYPAETEPRPALSVYVHDVIEPGKIPFAWIINTTAGESKSKDGRDQFRFGPWRMGNKGPSAPFKSAFVYYNPETRKTQLFDFVQVSPRQGGRKVHFYGDQMFDEMTGINLMFEYDERFPLTEMLAYEVYRRAGMAAEKSYHVRTWVNGKPIGYQLLVEQPNKAFLRRNKIRDDGNMYKLIWYGNGLVGQHEKKTNTREGHGDLVSMMKEVNTANDREQWDLIKKHFDVEQVATYFAVNTVLSYWDGFFNNYFAYHDVKGTGKWTMYPWDQDKTWGITDGSNRPLYNMALTYGMNGDHPPGSSKTPGPGSSAMIHQWWRPPGWFSGPLLANPYFRKIFLSRTRELLEKVYNEEQMLPLIDGLKARLQEDVRLRAELHGADPANAMQRFEANLQFLREHLKKRRQFLLAQKELQDVTRPAN